MKNSELFCSVSLLFLSFSLSAQSDSAVSGITYFNNIHTGGLLGKKGYGATFSTSTVHGVRWKELALGVGVGYDAYPDWRTLPVFGSAAYDVLRLRQNVLLFLQFNAGYSRAWNPPSEDDQFTFTDGDGVFMLPLIGWRIRSGPFSLYLSAGYKVQNIKYEQTSRWGGWPGSVTTVDRDIERVSVQLGFGWH